jgi:hypothetical protein
MRVVFVLFESYYIHIYTSVSLDDYSTVKFDSGRWHCTTCLKGLASSIHYLVQVVYKHRMLPSFSSLNRKQTWLKCFLSLKKYGLCSYLLHTVCAHVGKRWTSLLMGAPMHIKFRREARNLHIKNKFTFYICISVKYMETMLFSGTREKAHLFL